jgi:hypothetical protein
MTDHAERPLLFLDVDGTLLPFGQDPQRQPGDAAPDSHLARLSPEVGFRLAALPCELVWASTWEDEANAEVAPRIGLPPLPVVNWPEPSAEGEREDQWFGLHWKTRALRPLLPRYRGLPVRHGPTRQEYRRCPDCECSRH